MDGITFTNTLPVTGTLNVTNSTMTGMLTVSNGGVLSVGSTSTLNANGSLTVASGGSLNLAGSAYLYMYGPVTNSGTINVTNGLIYIYNNGTAAAQGGLVNLSGGLISLDGTGGIQGNVYGAGSSYDYFINGGTVTKVTGTGSSSIAVAQETLAGIYNAAAGTTVLFSGGSSTTPLQEDPGLVLNGPGQYQFTRRFPAVGSGLESRPATDRRLADVGAGLSGRSDHESGVGWDHFDEHFAGDGNVDGDEQRHVDGNFHRDQWGRVECGQRQRHIEREWLADSDQWRDGESGGFGLSVFVWAVDQLGDDQRDQRAALYVQQWNGRCPGWFGQSVRRSDQSRRHRGNPGERLWCGIEL